MTEESSAPPIGRRDVAIVALLGALVFVTSTVQLAHLRPDIFDWPRNWDRWFHSDTMRYYLSAIGHQVPDLRTSVHPLVPVALNLPVRALAAAGVSPDRAVAVLVGVIAGAWAGTMFLLLRLNRHHRTDAVLFTGIAITSSAAMFFLPLPETYPLGAITMMMALAVVSVRGAGIGVVGHALVSAATLSITVTNWMAGLLATWVSWPWRRASQISVGALAIVVVLWAGQKLMFPRAEFFAGSQFLLGSDYETTFIAPPEWNRPARTIVAMVLHSIVMPAIQLLPIDEQTGVFRLILSVQESPPGSAGVLSAVGVGIWSVLLVVGLYGWASHRTENLRLSVVLGGIVLAQLTLHTIYGEEVFLYSLHVAPPLVLVAAFACRTAARRPVLLLVSALIATAGTNNLLRFIEAATLLRMQHPYVDPL